MLGTINKQHFLSEALQKYPEIVEVYTDTDFSFEKDYMDMYVLRSSDFHAEQLLYDIHSIFSMGGHVYLAKSSLDTMLNGKKIVWRKGKWYL